MKLTAEEKATCSKYRKRDITGHVHCNECPLVISRRDALCKRTATKKEWEAEHESIRTDSKVGEVSC